MLYHLLLPLSKYISGFNLFKYITFRAGAAAVTALLLSFIIGPIVIRLMKKYGAIEEIRKDGPSSHLAKTGTPTMGGIIILVSLLSGTLLFARWDNLQVWLLVIATVWMGVVGFIDDYLKLKQNKKGLIPRYKLLGQLSLGLLIGSILFFGASSLSPQFAELRTLTTLPFLKNSYLNFGLFGLDFLYIVFVTLIITGFSNGVNLSDGLDGLAIGLIGIIATGFAILAYITGHSIFSHYLNICYLPGSGEIAVYTGALVGCCLGYLWYNTYPAQIFQGDTGALALGAGIATVSILIKKEIFLFILGGVLVAEVLSVIIQRYYFKYTRKKYGTGRRVFLCSPIHHHFELKGWAEPQVVVRFWIIGILLLFLTMTSFKVR